MSNRRITVTKRWVLAVETTRRGSASALLSIGGSADARVMLRLGLPLVGAVYLSAEPRASWGHRFATWFGAESRAFGVRCDSVYGFEVSLGAMSWDMRSYYERDAKRRLASDDASWRNETTRVSRGSGSTPRVEVVPTYRPDGYPWHLGRVARLRGLRVSVLGCGQRMRLVNRVLGRRVLTETFGDWEPLTIPMPDRDYTARIRFERREWKRPRWPRVLVREGWEIDFSPSEGTDHPPAFAGKGENSWDCDDDGFYGVGVSSRETAADEYRARVMEQRARYGEPSKPGLGASEVSGG